MEAGKRVNRVQWDDIRYIYTQPLTASSTVIENVYDITKMYNVHIQCLSIISIIYWYDDEMSKFLNIALFSDLILINTLLTVT